MKQYLHAFLVIVVATTMAVGAAAGPQQSDTSASLLGRVVDARTHQPLQGVKVRVAGATLPEPRSVETDAQGQYQIDSLPAGFFRVTATKFGYVEMIAGQREPGDVPRPFAVGQHQALARADFTLPLSGEMAGRVVDESDRPVTNAHVVAMRLMYSPAGRTSGIIRNTRTDVSGEFRVLDLVPGDYIVYAEMAQATQVGVIGSARTYFPGTTDFGEAHIVTIASGQTQSAANIRLAAARRTNVTGSVFDAKHRLVTNGTVGVAWLAGNSILSNAVNIHPDGSFVIGGVPPGQYRLSVSLSKPPAAATMPSMAIVDVKGADITNVRLEVPQLLSMTGRITFDAAIPAAERPKRLPAALRLTAISLVPDVSFVEAPADFPDNDQGFALHTLPGHLRIDAKGLPPGWAVRQIRHRGIDVTDAIDVSGDLDDIEVELTNRTQLLTGRVADRRGAPVPDAWVIVIARNRQSLGPQDGSTVLTDDRGHFETRALRHGEYYAFAVSRIEAGRWWDQAYQDSMIPSATRVTLGDGETKSIDLRVLDDR